VKTNVAILDSGAGGLSILREITTRQLSCDCIYLADLKYLPYGKLSETTLKARMHAIVKKLIAQFKPGIIIIGCNTASTSVLDSLRKSWSIPFIGVVPAVKPAAALSRSKVIGVLATPATVQRNYLDKLIRDFASDTEVVLHGSTALVDQCERYLKNKNVDNETINRELEKLLSQNPELDKIVLACTHFSIIKPLLEEHIDSKKIEFIESTEAIVDRLISLKPEIVSSSASSNQNTIFITTDSAPLAHYAEFLGLSSNTPTLTNFI